MSKIKLPTEIENLKSGPHKRDMIKHLKKQRRKIWQERRREDKWQPMQ